MPLPHQTCFLTPAALTYLFIFKAPAMIVVYIIIGLIALLLIIATVLPSSYNIERNTVITCPVDFVKNKISDLNHYSEWNPWQQSDPKATKTITGTPSQPGHRYEWNGPKVGNGHLTLTSLDERHVHFKLQFIKPFASIANDNWLFEPWHDTNTKVTWQNNGKFAWPVARLMGPFIMKHMGQQFEKGLNNLKKMCEEGS